MSAGGGDVGPPTPRLHDIVRARNGRRATVLGMVMRRSALLAAAAAIVAAAPAPAVAAPAGPVDFEQAVPAPAGGAVAARAARTTPPIAAPRPFDLLGLRWRGGGARDVAVRVRRADGRWSRWAPLPHAEDAVAGADRGARATGPLWTGRAVAYQLRGVVPRTARVRFVRVPRRAGAPVAARASGRRPAIVGREQWDPTGSCTPRTTPSYGRIDFSVVHHTDTLARYRRAAAPAVVLGICRFHRNANGWNDIGYNLLVDRFGTVYEGRAGGVEQPVIGAHAAGWNSRSTGVAVIGSHTVAQPSRAAQRALVRVLAWKLSLAGVPPTGTVATVSPGGAQNRWRAGARVRYERVVGHRDTVHTQCPGPAFYRLLPALRTQVAAAHALDADLLTSSPIGGVLPQGGPAQLTGRLALADGRRPAHAALSLQRREGDAWVEIDTVRTGADGIWTATVPLTATTALRVVSEEHGVAAPPIEATVAAGVTLRVAPQRLRRGGTVTVSGVTTPAKRRVTVRVERRVGSGWRRVRQVRVATVDGTYARTVRLRARGVHRFTATTPADADNAAGVAPVRTANVR